MFDGSASMRVRNIWKEHKAPFCTAMICGLLAFTYFFTNKLPNFDDVAFLFTKGAELESGRWGLELCELIFPNYSMPWLWGIISLVLMSVSACLTVDLFRLKSGMLRCLLAGLIVVFPSQLTTFTYMFTSSSYAAAFLFAVLAVRTVRNAGHWWEYGIAWILLTLSLGIYQSYIAIAAGLFVLLMISDTYRTDEPVKKILLKGVIYLVFLLAAAAAYYGITLLLLSARGQQFGDYAQDALGNPQSLAQRFYTCFRSFMAVYVPNYRLYGLVVSPFSAYVHVAGAVAAVASAVWSYIRSWKWGRFAFLAALTVLVFPLSLTCMLFVAGELVVHTLVMYSFVLVYILLAIFVDPCLNCKEFFPAVCPRVLALCFALIIACNAVESNRAALAEQFEYENTYALYNTVAAQVQGTPGFTSKTRVALIGKAPVSNVMKTFGWSEIMGVMGAYDGNAITLRNGWSREDFIHFFLGLDWNFVSEEEVKELAKSGEVREMPSYPDYGYVQLSGDVILVKLSD